MTPQIRRFVDTERAVDRGDHHADRALAAAHVARRTREPKRRAWLDRRAAGRGAVGERGEHAERRAPCHATGELARAEDARRTRDVHTVGGEAGELRVAPDAPRVEELLRVRTELEDRHPLEEEGAPLLEEGLECGEVELRGIRLDLAE